MVAGALVHHRLEGERGGGAAGLDLTRQRFLVDLEPRDGFFQGLDKLDVGRVLEDGGLLGDLPLHGAGASQVPRDALRPHGVLAVLADHYSPRRQDGEVLVHAFPTVGAFSHGEPALLR